MAINVRSTRLFALMLAGLLNFVAATAAAGSVTVYTDRVAWELAAAGVSPFGFISENFDDETPGLLAAGSNLFWGDPGGYLIIDIPGDPGLNSIEDGSINPVIGTLLSPNGSNYFLGHAAADSQPQLLFQPFAASPNALGFGADWVLGSSDLMMEIRGTVISLSDFLPTGEGFLGIITSDSINSTYPVTFFSGGFPPLFGIDNLVYVPIPIPAAWPLLLSGLISLSLLKRRSGTWRSVGNA